jgi:hypothetical protein
MISPFNSPLETGVRALIILTAAFPHAQDLQHLVFFDYLTVHSGDVQGPESPESLHAPIPMRAGELTVRRELIKRGLFLMISRGLVRHLSSSDGFQYAATDDASAFLSMMNSPYTLKLRERAEWVIECFGSYSAEEIQYTERSFFRNLLSPEHVGSGII